MNKLTFKKKINSNNINKAFGLSYGFIYRKINIFFLKTGKGFRKSPFSQILNKRNANIGNDFDLKFGATISGECFSCGHNVGIGTGSHIIGKVMIGCNVRIAQNVVVVSDYYGIEKDNCFLNQPGYSKGPISIGNGVWIGANSIILSGVTIGEGACIGAGSVVTDNIPKNAIAVGNPAHIIKFRS